MRSLVAFILGLVLLVGVVGPLPAAPPAYTVVKQTLANGLQIVIVPNPLAPVVSTDMAYLVGSRDDPPSVPGMAHAQEHMMFRGTKELTTTELGTVATALGGNFNAFTQETVTHFQFTVPSANLDAVFRIESDRMHNLLDSQSQWEDERGAIEQEVSRDLETPGADFFSDAQAIAFAGTPYAHNGVGTLAAFDKLTGTQLKAFYDKWYAPNNAVFTIAGNVDPAQVMAMIHARFDAVARHAVPAQPVAHFAPMKRAVIRRTTSLVYPLAAVGYRMPGVDSPDFIASFVLQGVLDAERGPLHALSIEGAALEGEWQSMPYFPEGQLGFAIAALAPGSDPDVMVKRLESILADIVKNGVSPELFESTKRRLVAGQELSRNSISALASDWSDVIALDKQPSIAREKELIAAVKLSDIERVARQYFKPSQEIVGALTPSARASSAAPPTQANRSRENPLQPRAATQQLPSWAQSLVSSVALPPSSLNPTTTTLPNGITLIVQPETISDSVLVYGDVRSNPALQEPQGKEGVSSVLDQMFDYGTATMDRNTFQRALDTIASTVNGGTGFALQTTSTDFDRGVALLGQNELSPRFDEQTFTIARQRIASSLQASLNGSHTEAVREAARKLLPSGDPELREPSMQTLGGLTLSDAQAYYTQVFRPDVTTIVVIGNVTTDRARNAIEKAFGGWHASGTPGNLELPPVPVNPPGEVHISLPGMRQDSITLEQMVSIRRTDPAFFALEVGNAVLGGGAGGPEQSRLFRDLRQNSGLVYYVNSKLAAGQTRARFEIQYACAAKDLSRAQQIVNNDIERLQTENAGQFELALTKASVVRRLQVGQSSTDAIGNSLLRHSTSGLPLDEDHIAAQRYLATDAAAVKSAFATYIKPQNFVRTIEGP